MSSASSFVRLRNSLIRGLSPSDSSHSRAPSCDLLEDSRFSRSASSSRLSPRRIEAASGSSRNSSASLPSPNPTLAVVPRSKVRVKLVAATRVSASSLGVMDARFEFTETGQAVFSGPSADTTRSKLHFARISTKVGFCRCVDGIKHLLASLLQRCDLDLYMQSRGLEDLELLAREAVSINYRFFKHEYPT